MTEAALRIRTATADDLPAVIGLHAADAHGHGDAWTPETEAGYHAAFAAIDAHPDHAIYVAERDGEIVGTFMLSLLPGLTGRGLRHAQLRAVQVRADLRSHGIGAQMVAFAEERAAQQGARVMELMSNAGRTAAHRFYERLGYLRSHAAFKKRIGARPDRAP